MRQGPDVGSFAARNSKGCFVVEEACYIKRIYTNTHCRYLNVLAAASRFVGSLAVDVFGAVTWWYLHLLSFEALGYGQ
jgi:hypothetical protein